jgi:hypothetical protein
MPFGARSVIMKKTELSGIMLLNDTRYSHHQALKDAYSYFDVLSGTGARALNDQQFKGANKIGMVDLVCLTNKDARSSPDNDDELELTAVMESLSNILVAAVLSKAGKDEDSQVRPSLWEQGFNALVSLFCSDYSKNTVHYSDQVSGIATVSEVIKIAFDVNGEPEGKLKDDITDYLQKQGRLMDEMGYDGTLDNPYTLIGFSNFLKDEKRRCCFTAYFTTFNVETVKIYRTCMFPQIKFKFDFMVTHCNANFMIARWETDPAFRQRVKDFINNHPPGEDYFDGWDTGSKIDDVPSA